MKMEEPRGTGACFFTSSSLEDAASRGIGHDATLASPPPPLSDSFKLLSQAVSSIGRLVLVE